jgi:threonine/homoserine efflux transporter RhtA
VGVLLWLAVTTCWLGYIWTGGSTTQTKWGQSAWVLIAMAVVAAWVSEKSTTEDEDE